MNTFQELGALALGSRLKRLGDSLIGEVERIYENYSLDLKPSCFPMLWTLQSRGPQSVTELAGHLGVSHPAITQTARELIQSGWIIEERDERDSRRRNLSVSEKTTRLLTFLKPLWESVRLEIEERLASQAPGLLAALSDFEAGLEESSLAEAVEERHRVRFSDTVEIVSWRPELKQHFTSLNKEWIEEYFSLEEKDYEILENPESSILAKGGQILFAVDGPEVLGTCVLIPHPEKVFELTKMAVAKAARGRRIGVRLCTAALELARQQGAKSVFLESHHSLRPALTMYEKLGFQYSTFPTPSAYSRADIYMYKMMS